MASMPERTEWPAFVVLDLPEPLAGAVARLRRAHCPRSAALPVEITLAGSSGLAPLPPGTAMADIRRVVGEMCRTFSAFELELDEMQRFAGSGVFFLSPRQRQPFDALHVFLRDSCLPFGAARFPYRPHCTVRNGGAVPDSEAGRLLALPTPAGRVMLRQVSVYALDAQRHCHLLHRAYLSA